MSGDLTIAIIVFLASAASVIYLGAQLAKYGDALASLTGLGRVFIGSILVALVTSLPELSTNFAAVRLDPPNPGLAIGNILGANMLNMFTFAAVALAFGGKAFLERVAPEQSYLALLAAVMTGAAVVFGVVKINAAAWQTGLSSLVLLLVYIGGMWVVYVTRPQEEAADDDEEPNVSLRRAWTIFVLVSVGVIIAGVFLAWSADRIADLTGVASSTLGILAVSFVTTMPEASATIAAARMGAADLGISGLVGSCVFNVSILCYADLLYRDGILINQAQEAHLIAGAVAFALLLTALSLILWRGRIVSAAVRVILALMASTYIAAALVVTSIGQTSDTPNPASAVDLPDSSAGDRR